MNPLTRQSRPRRRHAGRRGGEAAPSCRSNTAATIAVTIAMAAQMPAVTSKDCTNASRAERSNSIPSGSRSWSATATAAPSVLNAACAASGGTPVGMAPANSPRYTAVPTLPRTAIRARRRARSWSQRWTPRAPARSGGTIPTMMSVAKVVIGARPRDRRTDRVTRTGAARGRVDLR